ncbi:LexA family protein [Olsenella phocaeensis]|uniref:LexA family protein n=1 Tax=Olsenella phocaeensis TaxID=1852385 RepID=UPI003A8DC75F
MGLPENIDALLVKYDINQEALARVAGVAPSSITRWRNGAQMRKEPLRAICKYFGITEDDLLSDSYGLAAKEHGYFPSSALTPVASEVAYAPLLGRVHAGDAQEPDVLDDEVPVPAEVLDGHPRAYFLEVEGQCMSRVYPEGCHILIDPDSEPTNGSIAVVSIDGADYVMRRLYRGASTLVLSPDSWDEGYEDIVVRDGDGHEVSFHGCVVWFQASKEME